MSRVSWLYGNVVKLFCHPAHVQLVYKVDPQSHWYIVYIQFIYIFMIKYSMYLLYKNCTTITAAVTPHVRSYIVGNKKSDFFLNENYKPIYCAKKRRAKKVLRLR